MRRETAAPVVLVCGLGRCGTSLVMQMLARSGLRCAGSFPDFEPSELMPRERPTIADSYNARDFIVRHDAAKLLAPHTLAFRDDFAALVVWLDRDFGEQARSGLKVVRELGQGVTFAPDAEDRLARHLEADRARSVERLRGWPRIELRFEALVRDPHATAGAVADFVAPHGISLDPDEMASAALARGPESQPTREIESRLLAAGESSDVHHHHA
jgi:hypothetical protein